MKKYLIELIGTFFWVLVMGLTSNPMTIGSALMVMVYMGWHVSGAHYNPAITLAMLIQKKITAKDTVLYIIFQLFGAILSALLLTKLVGHTFAPSPGFALELKYVVLAEIIFTFILAIVVLNVTVSKAAKGNSYYGLAIGFTLMTAISSGGWMSGGTYNPAIGLAACLVDTFVGGNNSLSNVWIYLVGPFAGGTLASLVFGFTEKK